MHVHAPLDAPPARGGLVDGEVVARAVAERDEEETEQARSLLQFVTQFKDRLHCYLKFVSD